MDYNILLQIGIGISTIIVGYTILKQKVVQHDENIKDMDSELKESFKKRDDTLKDELKKISDEFNRYINKVAHDLETCFKKYDVIEKDLVDYKIELQKKVTLKEVTDEFVTRKELKLELELINKTTINIEKEVSSIDEQMKRVLSLLQDIKSNKKD